MTRRSFEQLMERLGQAWNAGDASAAAACFSGRVDYADPARYRFSSRAQLVDFFDPGPTGHRVDWHRLLFDEIAGIGVVEYTYQGLHRYHGAAIIEFDGGGLISGWREWQHQADDRDWATFLSGDA